MGGTAKLFDLILSFIKNITPYVIILQFQKGVRYTFGKNAKVLNPGIYFKFPYLQIVVSENITDTTSCLAAQSVITDDRKEVIVKAIVGYCITDIEKFYNKVTDTRSAILDISSVVIKNNIQANNYDDILKDPVTFSDLLRSEVQKQVKKYGIKINFIGITDFTASRSYRLFNEVVPIGQ